MIHELMNLLQDLEAPYLQSKEFEFGKDESSLKALKIEDLGEVGDDHSTTRFDPSQRYKSLRMSMTNPS